MNNFQPIALLSIKYKIYTAIINYKLNQIIEKNELISKKQAGFKPNMDTSLNVNSLINVINHSNINKKKLHIMYIDFSKAYNSVQHWAIDETMDSFGFSTQTKELLNYFFLGQLQG